MIIDVHGHYTTAPRSVQEWRQKQIAAFPEPFNEPFVITDDEIIETISKGQLKLQQVRGTDVTLFSPTAGGMAHHYGDEKTSLQWTRLVNDNIKKVCTLFPDNFVPVCQIPQSPGISPKNCLEELEYRVLREGFVGVNINLDPTDGYWTDPPLTDEWWYPLYEKMCELNIPGMIHTSMSCNPNFHGTGAHYLNGDTSAFMQFIQHQHPFDRFPTLQFVIPHGGGAVPYHWGRYRGIGLDAKKGEIAERLLQNVSFDTCVYHQIGINCLTEAIPAGSIIFASEMIGAVRGIDPRTGRYFDDTKPYIDASPHLTAADKEKVFENNARRVYPRLAQYLK